MHYFPGQGFYCCAAGSPLTQLPYIPAERSGLKEKPGWRMSLLPLPSILTGALNSIPSARSKGKACGGWSWLHVLIPKYINAQAPTLSFLHQTPQLIPGLFYMGRMTCLVTAQLAEGSSMPAAAGPRMLGKLVHHTLEATPLP